MPGPQKGGSWFGQSDYTNYTMESGVNSGVIQYLYYFIILTIIILLCLVVIHFTYTPIFITRPGSKGIISLPGSNDEFLVWKTAETLNSIPQDKTPIGTSTNNYSVLLDLILDDPTKSTNYPRILMARSEPISEFTGTYGDQSTILNIVPNFNLIVYFDRLTNDLNVALQTTPTGIENVIIPNIPIRKSVRLGIMVGAKVLEVYVNGYLAKTKTFSAPIRSIAQAGFQPPLGSVLAGTARVRNLRLWNRPLAPSEFRSYGTAENVFDLKQIADSCA